MQFNILLVGIMALVTFSGCATSPEQQVDLNKVYDLHEVTTMPIPWLQTPPEYSFELERAHISGKALIQFTVDQYGQTTDLKIVSASDPRLGDAAIAAVSLWKFKPAILNGIAVKCRMEIPFDFKLESRV